MAAEKEKIVIRPYTEEDWTAIEEIHDTARKLELEKAGLPEAFVPLKEEAVSEGLFDYQIDVALLEKTVVGFCAYTEEELAWLYVSPKQMRTGIGRQLIQHALGKEPGIRYIEVLLGNEPAKCLYEKMGFEVTEILSGQMPGNESFAVRVYSMERKKENSEAECDEV